MNIIQTEKDFLAFIADEAMDNGNLSIRGVARCCTVAHTSIIRDGAFKSEKLGKVLVAQGFKAGALLKDGFPPQAVWLCIEYFAYESNAKAPMAKQLARTFGAIGIMATLGHLTEPRQQEASPRQLPPIRDAIDYQQAIAALPSVTNPILRAALEQRFAEELGSTVLAKSDLVLVAVLARDLGYKLAPGQDSALGKWVRRHHEPKGKVQHGRYNPNVYDRAEIEDTVHAYFR
jgi:hypothetical protein